MGVAWLSGLALAGVCWAGARTFRDELKSLPAETGISVAMFDHGKLSMAPVGFAMGDWKDVDIPGAVGHSFSYEGMLSPDGTLAAFPYWEVNPCPSWKTCDIEADRHYYLAIVPTDGGSVRKYPQIVLPSEMCWSRDNSKLAMVAKPENDPNRRLLILHLDSGKLERLAEGETVAVTPQCWSPDGSRLAYFEGDKDLAGPGAIRILDTRTQQTVTLFRGGPDCSGDIMCASPYPTWSPDGEWIAYFHEKAYWAIHPSGEGRKQLFHRSNALSPLQWSPDMRYALYADCCALRDTWRCMCEIGRVHVRRLADNSDVEVSGDGYQDMYIPRWTWIQKKNSR
jgi:WD40 repeat protein